MGNRKKKAASRQTKKSGSRRLPRSPLLWGVPVLVVLVALLVLRPWRPKLTLPELSATGIVVMDAASGTILYEKNGDVPRPPSSLTKLMTTYLIFADLAAGTLSPDDTHTVTAAEAGTPGSKYGLHPGMTLTVDQLLAGTILNSGCDCVQALVSLSSGSEADFVFRMNDTAAAMKLSGTHFENATGLDTANHYMTPRDLAVLSRRLVTDYPDYLDYSAQATMDLDGLSFQNLNVLVGRDPRVQGLKTGTTAIGGNNLVIYADWAGKSYLIVLLDSASPQRRFVEAQTILDALYGEVDYAQP